MRIFGLDGGIASIGWAVLDIEEGVVRIIAAGVRTIDAPETAKERTPSAVCIVGNAG
jgi:CRISPR-associated endonuclease Csn1